MERLRRHRREETAAGPGAPDTGGLGAATAAGGIQVIWGPLTDRIEAANMTVGEIFRLLRVPFNIAPQAAALVNGELADPDRRLAEGDTLEFARRAGEKGAGEKSGSAR